MSTPWPLVLALLAAPAAAPAAAPFMVGPAAAVWADDEAAEAPALFVETVLPLQTDAGARLALIDADDDGLTDLLRIGPSGLHLHRMRANHRFEAEADWTLLWPAEKTGWDLADIDGDGIQEVVMLLNGQSVRAWRPGRDDGGRVLLEGLTGFLPRGIRHMRFMRDIDGDGFQDAVIPGSGRFMIHRGTPQGLEAEPLLVSFQADIGLQLGDPDSLDGRFGQDITIPLFQLRDMDGDGRGDLVSETENELCVHLATPELSAEPSWRLDLASLREEVERPERINLEDLFANIAPSVRWQVADIDGKPPLDLVLQRGGRFTLHLGGSRGPDLSAPDQVLKASGNVMHFLLRDVNGDGSPDLQILRAETISLGTVLRWLVISGSLDFDVFTYPNEGTAFARKPASRKAISLRVPAILGLIEDLDGIDFENNELFSWPAQPLCLDADGRLNDVVDVVEGGLVVVRDRVPSEWKPGLAAQMRDGGLDGLIESAAFGSLDDIEDGGALVVDLGKLDPLVPTPGWDLHLATIGHPTAGQISWPEGVGSVKTIRVLDMNADGLSDLLVVGDHSQGNARLQILVRKNDAARLGHTVRQGDKARQGDAAAEDQ